jgi:phosphatidate phosphatase APP1
LANNETLSQEAIRTYEGVKRSWYENAHNYEPTIFAVSDLSLNTYETLKLHQYLLAESARFIKGYYYPILAFISQG